MLYSKVLFQNIIKLYADYWNPSIVAKNTRQNPILIFRRRPNSCGKRHLKKYVTPTRLMYNLYDVHTRPVSYTVYSIHVT